MAFVFLKKKFSSLFPCADMPFSLLSQWVRRLETYIFNESLPEDKLLALWALITMLLAHKKCTLKELQFLVGQGGFTREGFLYPVGMGYCQDLDAAPPHPGDERHEEGSKGEGILWGCNMAVVPWPTGWHPDALRCDRQHLFWCVLCQPLVDQAVATWLSWVFC